MKITSQRYCDSQLTSARGLVSGLTKVILSDEMNWLSEVVVMMVCEALLPLSDILLMLQAVEYLAFNHSAQHRCICNL